MVKVILHIGQTKTGTTTIQVTCRRNRERLLQQGFLYPNCAQGVNHALLAVPVMNHIQRSLVRQIGRNYAVGVQRSHEAWAAVAAEYRKTRPEAVILSSEFFFSAPHVERLPELIATYIDPAAEIRVIGYLRIPSEHYVSALQQKLKASHNLPNPQPPKISQIRKFGGIGALVLRKFARPDLVDGDIVQDFCQTLGIDPDPLRHLPDAANATLSAEGVILLQDYRRRHHAERDNVFTEDTHRYIARINEICSNDPHLCTRPQLRPEFAQALDRDCSNLRFIREEYGIDLRTDHGISADQEKAVTTAGDVRDLIIHDSAALEQLRQALGE